MRLDDWAKKGRNYNGNENDLEYFEDTHGGSTGTSGVPDYSQTPSMKQQKSIPQKVLDTSYLNGVGVYEPRTPEDVQQVIDYLKARNPVVVNLDNVEIEAAQRILDFVSGATYALGGSVHRIAGNIFLLSPQGVGITAPYDEQDD